MRGKIIGTIFASALIILLSQNVYAESTYEEKLDFAASLEEILGHFWAIEQNLDEGNAELALVHATHPIAELYVTMKPALQESDSLLDSQVQTTLLQLKDKATTTVSRAQAQAAIDDAKGLVEIARSTIVGDQLSNEPSFKMKLMKTLLETSIAEYSEAISDGMIEEMAEFQDGSAFVWRSQQIFDEIKLDIDSHMVDEIEELYDDLEDAYDNQVEPAAVETLVDGIIHEIDAELGIEDEEYDLLGYVNTIQNLLEQTKSEYSQGNTDLALSLATKAYLDNFEFLEGPLVDMDEEELMEEVEHMLREELRDMIKNNAPASEVNSQVDDILEKMDAVAVVVPEFDVIAIMILAVAIVSIIVATTRTKLSLISRF